MPQAPRRSPYPQIETLAYGYEQQQPLHRVRMKNGLIAYILPDPTTPVVSLQTWFAVGSRDEVTGKTGQAHLLEHLMFNETKKHKLGEFDRKMEYAGGETNAATWCDWTYYYENVPASELSTAMELESDRMRNLVLRKEQVESELGVVASERRDRVEDDIDGALGEAMYRAAFGSKHPYGWPTIGWMRDIKAFTKSDCFNFYQRHYAPQNATLVIAGSVTLKRALTLLDAHYGKISGGPTPRRRSVPKVARPKQRLVQVRKETDSTRAILGFVVPGYATPEFAVLSVLQSILTGGRSTRLYQGLVRERAIVSDVRASTAPFEATSLFEISFVLRSGQTVAAAEKQIWNTLQDIAKNGVREDELQIAKARLELGVLSGLETAAGRADQIGFSVAVTGDPNFGWHRLREYQRVSSQDLSIVCKRYLQPSMVVRAIAHASGPKKAKRRQLSKGKH